MSAVTITKARPCAPVGYEVNDKVELAEAVTAGALLSYTGTQSDGQAVMELTPAGSAEADGIALQDGYAGQRGFSVGIQGEMDGFSGLTPGDALYPSASVDGGLDTTAPTTPGEGDPVTGAVRVKAVKTTRIRFNFV